MNKTLVILVIIGLFLVWKFVLFPEKLDFTDKMKVLQGLTLARDYKAAIARYWREHQHFPDREQWLDMGAKIDVDLGKSIVGAIRVAEKSPGSITVYYSNVRDPGLAPGISGKSLTLMPYLENDRLEWSCKGDVPVEYLPAPCR